MSVGAETSKEERARRVAEGLRSRAKQRKAAMAAVMQRRIEEKQRRIAARREAGQRRKAARVVAAAVAVPAASPLSVCPWWSGDVEPVPYGGVTI